MALLPASPDQIVRNSLMENRLIPLGINLLDVGEELQEEGVDKFIQPFDELLETIQKQTEPIS